MSSQKQCHRIRAMFADYWDMKAENKALRMRVAYLERRPPWWKPWAVKKWKAEDDHG